VQSCHWARAGSVLRRAYGQQEGQKPVGFQHEGHLVSSIGTLDSVPVEWNFIAAQCFSGVGHRSITTDKGVEEIEEILVGDFGAQECEV